jgi:hypothetical protein
MLMSGGSPNSLELPGPGPPLQATFLYQGLWCSICPKNALKKSPHWCPANLYCLVVHEEQWVGHRTASQVGTMLHSRCMLWLPQLLTTVHLPGSASIAALSCQNNQHASLRSSVLHPLRGTSSYCRCRAHAKGHQTLPAETTRHLRKQGTGYATQTQLRAPASCVCSESSRLSCLQY